jgi:hypothetical protein
VQVAGRAGREPSAYRHAVLVENRAQCTVFCRPSPAPTGRGARPSRRSQRSTLRTRRFERLSNGP